MTEQEYKEKIFELEYNKGRISITIVEYLKTLIKKVPNNEELGAIIREIFNEKN